MGKSLLCCIFLAGTLILASSSSYSQTIECDGTVVSGSGNFSSAAPCSPLRYMYKIDDTSFAVPETVYIGTHDNIMSNYTNVCIPAGWTFDIVSTPQDDYNGSTPHANISPGPDGTCPFNIVLISGAGASVPLYFGFDHPDKPHDVGWKIITHVWVSSNWSEPVGDGLGPVHAPRCDSVLIGGDINGDGIILAIADIIYLDNFVRGLGPAPIPLWAGDLNADGYIDALDVLLFKDFISLGFSVFPQYPIPVSCDPDTVRGACCIGDTCLILSQFNCEDTTGTYFDNATFCENFICPSSISGVKFEDINCDGIRDANEPVIPGWPIHLYEGTNLVASTNTGTNGDYLFSGLTPGIYRVTEETVWGWIQTFPPTVLYRIDLLDGQNLIGFDFGNTRDTCIEPSFVTAVVQEAGTRDNFVGPEASTPDLAVDLAGVIKCAVSDHNFDSPHFDKCFAHTFSGFKDSSCCVIGGELCLRLRAGNGDPENDIISIVENGVTAWQMSLSTLMFYYTDSSDSSWSPGDIIDTCLNLKNLPPDFAGITNVLAVLHDNDFSIYMGDDTEADFFELTVILCCPGDSVSSCCLPDGSCIEVAGVSDCDSLGGAFTAGIGCTPNYCPPESNPDPDSCVIFDAECCDGKPIVAQKQNHPNFRGQVAIASCFAPALDMYSVGIIDLSDQRTAPIGTPTLYPNGFVTPMYHNENSPNSNPTNNPDDEWTKRRIGTVFGLALDRRGNIYAAASACYKTDYFPPPGNGGEIYKLDGVTGAVTNFVIGSIPNSKEGLGNIAYDCLNDQLFASNMDDGLIYRISNVVGGGTMSGTYDHGVDGRPEEGLTPIVDDGLPGVTKVGRRIWGLAVAKGIYSGGSQYYRLFYSVYWEDISKPLANEHNEIWSVRLNPSTGDFVPNSARLEISLPTYNLNYSCPVSDITFKSDGRIVLAERTMFDYTWPYAHRARILEYACDGTFWERQVIGSPAGNVFQIPADLGGGPSSTGGVDIDFRDDYNPPWDGRLWAMGDALRYDNTNNFYMYGLAGFPPTGGTTAKVAGNAILIDLDGNTTNANKTNLGDVEIPCKCCNGSRGDVNGDGIDNNILDLTYCVDFIFRGGRRAPCPQESDINGDFSTLNILDLTFIVDFVFRGGQAAGPCY